MEEEEKQEVEIKKNHEITTQENNKPVSNHDNSTEEDSISEHISKKINYKNLIYYNPGMKIEIINNEGITNYDLNFKIILIGNSGVGKSCITLKATKDIFKEDFTSTIGFLFFSYHVKINDKLIKLQIWDTCGQEIYKALITQFYRSSALAIICYSVTDRKSFKDVEAWIKNVKSNSNPDCKLFLIANKIDLPNRVISTEEGKKCQKENGFECYMETSAKNGINVNELFVNCTLTLYKELDKYIKEKELMELSNRIKLNDDSNYEEKDCAC